MKMMKDYRVAFVKPGQADLIEADIDETAGKGEIFGRNILSLISTGSERGGFSQTYDASRYPVETGYSSIARVISVGEGVADFKPGDLFYHNEHHTLYVKVSAGDAIALPEGLMPEKALFGRYAAVSMTSVYHSKSKPVDNVVVTGLGMVGLMCAQMLKCFGFRVYAIDPSEERQRIAREAGLTEVAGSIEDFTDLKGKAAVLYECSGNEKAMSAVMPYLRKGGEIFQIGVPWKKSSDWDAHTLLYDMFYGFISIHGGWEWSIPRKEDDFHAHSNYSHIRMAMECIADGRVKVINEMYELRNPKDCGAVYQEIMVPRMQPTSIMFDWRDFKAD